MGELIRLGAPRPCPPSSGDTHGRPALLSNSNPDWLSFFYGTHSFVWFLGSRAVQFAITSVVNAAVIFGLFKSRVFDVLHLWPPVGVQAPVQENNNQASVIS